MEAWQLQQLQGLPLEVKIRKTKERIKEWHEHWDGQVYVSFSGGKDSTVLLHIAREIYPNIEAVFVDTGLEYPEIRTFVKGFDNVLWLRPEMNFRQVIEQHGYPVISKQVSRRIYDVEKNGKESYAYEMFEGKYLNKDGEKSIYNIEKWKFLLDAPFKISHKCCNIMKKKPAHMYGRKSGKKPMTGQMTEESVQRKVTWLQNGCNGFEMKSPISNPIAFWKEEDVLQYILKKNIKIASCYGEIIQKDQVGGQMVINGCMTNLTTSKCKRTGCMFCMFGVHLEKEPNRFQMMKETHPKQYDYCINKLGLGNVLDFIKVKH